MFWPNWPSSHVQVAVKESAAHCKAVFSFMWLTWITSGYVPIKLTKIKFIRKLKA
jgi:hypothetical protein